MPLLWYGESLNFTQEVWHADIGLSEHITGDFSTHVSRPMVGANLVRDAAMTTWQQLFQTEREP